MISSSRVINSVRARNFLPPPLWGNQERMPSYLTNQIVRRLQGRRVDPMDNQANAQWPGASMDWLPQRGLLVPESRAVVMGGSSLSIIFQNWKIGNLRCSVGKFLHLERFCFWLDCWKIFDFFASVFRKFLILKNS